MNLFAMIHTHSAPASNNRGESENNRMVLQKITRGRFQYPIVSSHAIRNGIREILAGYGLPCNRSRSDNQGQIAVEYQGKPDAVKYVDDYFFGFMVATKKSEENGDCSKRDSILRLNMAVGLMPYRNDTILGQSPMVMATNGRKAMGSALLQREVVETSFQYPLALNLEDCRDQPEWTMKLLKAVGELSGAAGGHTSSYYEMAPASVVVRLTKRMVSGFDNYGYDEHGNNPELVESILSGDLPAKEFRIGGRILSVIGKEKTARLDELGVKTTTSIERFFDELGAEAAS